ncbi:MAG TPA: NAD(P)/FAD-dependent oxidoreductase [Gemmataceae bacterium]|nr:NAD(P)/FAD-dependent oxidoreductase [Gemmataceae bacterium]
MTQPQPVIVVGAGLAGAVMACYLARAGRRVDVYEKRSDPRQGGADHGRSINLALSTRGLHALREIGLAEDVLKSSVLMRGRMIHSPIGKLAFQPYGKDDSEALHSVSRAGLNRLLVEAAARYETVRLFFGRRCTGLNSQGRAVEFGEETAEAEAVVGADGAYSAVRGWMQRQDRFDYRQEYLSHGYKELTIPAGPGGAYRMEKHALHIWPRGRFMLIALPNRDGTFTGTLFAPFDGPDGFAALQTEADVTTYFRERFPDAAALAPELAWDFFSNPTGSLVTVRCQPWRIGRAMLIGDACHAVVPFLGQGMNAAFEDCTVLHECLQRHSWRWDHATADYESRRKVHADALADLCIENYQEMRDRTASPWFLLQKRMAVLLHRVFPRWYLPLYTMVEFTRIPYADAVRRARVQDRIVWAVALGLLALLTAAIVAFRIW